MSEHTLAVRPRLLMLKVNALLAILLSPFAAETVRSEPVARPSLAVTLQGVQRETNYFAASMSPDGRWTAWTTSVSIAGKTAAGASAIYLAQATAHARPARVSAAANAQAGDLAAQEKSVAWSPDSASLAFLSDAQTPNQLQLYVMRLSDRSIRRLTQVQGFLAAPQWSPDGKTIAVLFTENATRASGPLEAVPQETGVIGTQILEQRIATVDASSATFRAVSPADLYVYEYDWSPDGSTFAATAAHGSGDNNWYVAEIYLIACDGASSRSVLTPKMQIAVPRWSPDGKSIAFIGGLMSDESIASGELYVMPAAGGRPRNLTSQNSGSTYWFTWLAKSAKLLLADAVDGGSGLTEVDSRTGTLRSLWRGAEAIRGEDGFDRGISLAANGRTSALIRESFAGPPRLWIGAIGAWKPVTPAPSATAALWGDAENIKWSNDEFSVQGWLVPPVSIKSGVSYPMVVWVHGGPAWLNSPGWPTQIDYATLLAAQGYYVFFPNPRGSAGFGERFKRANIKDMGGGDLRDILAGVREVEATHPIDDRRVGITGWSYGGFMTLWAVTQTERFKAAVAGAGASDLLSYYGENGIDEWLIPYFGASVYDDPAVYAKSSPINFIKRVKTPTLLIVGDSDVEAPPPQSYEFWHALKTLGVKTELVVYPHEGHEFSDPAHVLDRLQRTVSWFDENMPALGDAEVP